MSEKIVQFNEEIIKGQIKELVRGSVEETLNELHACSKKFEFYCLTSREPFGSPFSAFRPIQSLRLPRYASRTFSSASSSAPVPERVMFPVSST